MIIYEYKDCKGTLSYERRGFFEFVGGYKEHVRVLFDSEYINAKSEWLHSQDEVDIVCNLYIKWFELKIDELENERNTSSIQPSRDNEDGSKESDTTVD